MSIPSAIQPDMSSNESALSSEALIARAEQHVCDILSIAFEHTPDQRAIVVFDRDCELALVLTEAYRRCLPDAEMMDFHEVKPDSILQSFAALQPKDLVVLIQSTNFRLEAYRLRVELFKRALKVIEHPHLARMRGIEAEYYIDALAYDPAYYRGTGRALKQKIDAAAHATIHSGNGAQLVFSGKLESAKLNVGDYRDMANTGGQFPIGEVFTESVDLEAVSGRVNIFVFGDTTFTVNRPEHPITLVVEKGQVVAAENSTEEFDRVLANIRKDDGVIWVRELGLGLNRAFSKERTVRDIGTYERMCGIHLSLGSKHGSYAKPHIKRGEGRHHVDVFAITEAVEFNDENVYQNGAWKV
jgi:aminopeptidase